MYVDIFIKERGDLTDVKPQPPGNLHLSEGQNSLHTDQSNQKLFPSCAPWTARVSQSKLHAGEGTAESGSAVISLSLAGSLTVKREP